MRVATLTLPLHVNYGAMLQAYALHSAIEIEGKEAILLDIRPSLYKKNLLLSLASYFKSLYRRNKHKAPEYGNKNFETFADTYIKKTDKIRFRFQFKKYQGFSSYVVGSDQVWRSEYALNIEMFFFNFLNENAKRFSYAASFGKADWTYTKVQEDNCKLLMQSFGAVSVREKSAVSLVKEKFDCNATHVLDPTMIIPVERYNNLIERGATKKYSSKSVFSYVLDINSEKRDVISRISKEIKMPEEICNDGLDDVDKMSIENWLKGIRDSGFVVTDSFHGMVFCLIFEKEFLILANNNRGYERFTSLLNYLGVTDRIVNEGDLKAFRLKGLRPIDYNLVNENLTVQRKKSIKFLQQALKL